MSIPTIEEAVAKYGPRLKSDKELPVLKPYSESLRVDWLARIQELNSAKIKDANLNNLFELNPINGEYPTVPKAHASGPLLEAEWNDKIDPALEEEPDGFYAGINENYATDKLLGDPKPRSKLKSEDTTGTYGYVRFAEKDSTLEKKIEKPQFYAIDSEDDEAPYKKPNFFKRSYAKFKSNKSPSKLEEEVEKSSTNQVAAASSDLEKTVWGYIKLKSKENKYRIIGTTIGTVAGTGTGIALAMNAPMVFYNGGFMVFFIFGAIGTTVGTVMDKVKNK
jgi:hypothetical protein